MINKNQSEFKTHMKPHPLQWKFFVADLQRIKDEIIDADYNPRYKNREAIKVLLRTNLEVLYGRDNA